jgi:hypothetical protein
MSTNARIGKLLPDGTIKHIYTHFDGYVEGGVGETLVDHYNEVAVIDELLSLGDLSILGASIHPKGEHSFDNREQGVCVFYGRDRGETEINAKYSTMDEFLDDKCIPYFYLFEGKNWWVKSIYSENTEWKLVKEFLSTYILTKEDYACNIEM